MTKIIAVHGATGSQGAPVAARLSAAGHTVRPLSRATGVDLFDRGVAGGGVRRRGRRRPPAAAALRRARAARSPRTPRAPPSTAGIEHLVINAGTPRCPPEPIGVPFLDARHPRRRRGRCPRVTVLQPTLYLENLSAAVVDGPADGVVAYPLPGDVPVPWVATADVAIAVERAIARDVVGWFALPGVPAPATKSPARSARAIGRPACCGRPCTPDEFADRTRPHRGDATRAEAHRPAVYADARGLRRARWPDRRPPARRRSTGRRATRPPGPPRRLVLRDQQRTAMAVSECEARSADRERVREQAEREADGHPGQMTSHAGTRAGASCDHEALGVVA